MKMMETDQPDGTHACRATWASGAPQHLAPQHLAPHPGLSPPLPSPPGGWRVPRWHLQGRWAPSGRTVLSGQLWPLHLCARSRKPFDARPSHRRADNNPYCYRPCSVFDNTPVQGVRYVAVQQRNYRRCMCGRTAAMRNARCGHRNPARKDSGTKPCLSLCRYVNSTQNDDHCIPTVSTGD